MTKDIVLNNLDLFRAIAYAHYRNKFIWTIAVVAGLLTEGIGYVGLWAMGWPIDGIINVTFRFLTFILVLNTIALIFTVIGLMLNPKWRKGRIGEHTLEITDDALVESTKFNKTEIFWPAIQKIVVKKKRLYITHQGVDVFIVPRRDFATEELWVEFTKKLKECWNAGRKC